AKIAAVARSVLGTAVPVLYGGSVNPENCAELIACPNIDGLFIGRSAWAAEGYLDILQRVAKAIPGKVGTGFPSGIA
ncbi:triose-phosphate isomerase, partial [Phyllobacterium sp. 22552]